MTRKISLKAPTVSVMWMRIRTEGIVGFEVWSYTFMSRAGLGHMSDVMGQEAMLAMVVLSWVSQMGQVDIWCLWHHPVTKNSTSNSTMMTSVVKSCDKRDKFVYIYL